ncbi:MAG: SipW-dependent-type signal peptide-containing protein [bacterium]|nr:SipW-dependent-type signal peptide-containing protein [bacterium]
MNNKKVLLAILGVGAVAGGGTLATRALFSDVEQSGSNVFTAGTLNMTVGGADGTAFESFNFTNLGVDGQVSGGKTWTIVNTGSVPGNLTISMNNLVNNDNGCNEPEAIVDTTCANPGPGEGELGAATTTTILLDRGVGDVQVVSSNLATASQALYASQWVTSAGVVTIPAGESVDVTMTWATNPNTYGNEIQSDGLTFQLQYDLVQVVPSV